MTAENLFDYFHGRVEEARAGAAVRISDDTSLYLATLLTDRARTDRPAPAEQTLAELHLRAANAAPAEQARTYRELGDRALYLLGYFAESLERRSVGPRYYAEMGSAAYGRADQVFKRWFSDAFGPVFRELAGRFGACVALIEEVREASERDGQAPIEPSPTVKGWSARPPSTDPRDRGVQLPPKRLLVPWRTDDDGEPS
jgi:hypothetical protein